MRARRGKHGGDARVNVNVDAPLLLPLLLLVAVLALHAPMPVSSSEADESSTFANGRSRRDALIGYSEMRGAGSGSGGEDDAGDNPVDVPWWCRDDNEKDCPGWAQNGECTKNAAYMNTYCKVSCGTCLMKRKKRAREGPRVYLDVTIGDGPPGRIVLDLFAGTHPKTSENFRQLCLGTPGWGYKGKERQSEKKGAGDILLFTTFIDYIALYRM